MPLWLKIIQEIVAILPDLINIFSKFADQDQAVKEFAAHLKAFKA